ncbi:MAG: SDH family Clp fold serine proteinase [Actinomycetes bacterium]
MVREGPGGGAGPGDEQGHPQGEADEFPAGGGADEVGPLPGRTPLFRAQHSERYARQSLLAEYEQLTGATLIVLIDQIFPANLTLLEELLFDCVPAQPLHVLMASPGGDGETAIRMVRSMQSRCSALTIVLPDMAKSAATLMCLGADAIVMGPAGDLGPVDPQFQIGGRGLAGAKEIVRAIDEAEERITKNPDTYPLFAGLLADVNMLMVEQARSALDRTEALVREALGCHRGRSTLEVKQLARKLQAPLIDDPASHSAVIPVEAARGFGLPAVAADPHSAEWSLIWALWTRYFTLGCFPAGQVAIYEGRRASHVIPP